MGVQWEKGVYKYQCIDGLTKKRQSSDGKEGSEHKILKYRNYDN